METRSRISITPSNRRTGGHAGFSPTAILEAVDDPIVCKDLSGTIVFWNKAAEEMFGFAAEEVLGESIFHIIPEEARADEGEVLRRLRAGEKVVNFETVRLTKAGRRLDVSLTISPVQDESGEIVGAANVVRDISARKKAEAALRENALMMKRAFTADTVGVLFFGMDGRIGHANAAFERMSGYSRDELIAMSDWQKLTAPEFLEATSTHAKDLAERGETRPYEKQMIRKNGTRWWGLFAPLRLSGEGRDSQCMEYIIDISDRKNHEGRLAEQARLLDHSVMQLTESEERFRQLGENIPQLAWMADPAGWIFWYNRRWYEYTGTTLEQMQGWGWEAVHHPDHAERVVAKWKRHLKGGEPWNDTFPLRGKDGQYRWFLSKAFPIRDASGKITRWFGTNTDITDLRRAQENLAEREAVLRTVTNEARVGLVMVDSDRRYLFTNQTFCDMIGLEECDIIGQRVPEVVPELYDQVRPNLDRALHGQRASYELRIPKHPKYGDERFYDVLYEPRILDIADPYVIIVLTDITERKRVEQRLEKLVADRTATLKETVGELETFSYTIAHDMRAPLRAMQSFSAILMQDYGNSLDPEAQTMLNRIAKSANRLDELIQDVLNYSKIIRADLRLEPVDTKPLIEEIIQSYPHLQPDAADIIISTPLPKVLGNRAALTQVFSNLLGNSVKFVPPGVRPKITIRCESIPPHHSSNPSLHQSGDGLVRLSFCDNGIGIESCEMPRLFQMFHRGHGLDEYEGTGMGLAIVRKAVERMGGRVGVESEPGNGSRFWVELRTA